MLIRIIIIDIKNPDQCLFYLSGYTCTIKISQILIGTKISQILLAQGHLAQVNLYIFFKNWIRGRGGWVNSKELSFYNIHVFYIVGLDIVWSRMVYVILLLIYEQIEIYKHIHRQIYRHIHRVRYSQIDTAGPKKTFKDFQKLFLILKLIVYPRY